MPDFTRQEQQVVIFLSILALVGLGISFFKKVNSPFREIISCDNRLYKIDLNQVTEGDLLSLQLFSPKLASQIIACRDSRGGFHTIEELREIKGIGKVRYEKIKDLFFIK